MDGRTDGWTDGRTDGRNDERKSPCVLQDFLPFRHAAKKRKRKKEGKKILSISVVRSDDIKMKTSWKSLSLFNERKTKKRTL